MLRVVSGGLDPKFEVYRPDGTLLCQRASASPGFIERDCTLNATGTHKIFVSDYGADETGDYELSLE